jgi:hypothetical protein
MYYEPSKKNYYRFPASGRIHDFEAKYHFPEKSCHCVEDSRYDFKTNDLMHSQESDDYS